MHAIEAASRGAINWAFHVPTGEKPDASLSAKSFQNFIGKTYFKKIFLDGAMVPKYFIKLCLFAKQPVATKEEMTRGSV